jgi:hypothetical protein
VSSFQGEKLVRYQTEIVDRLEAVERKIEEVKNGRASDTSPEQIFRKLSKDERLNELEIERKTLRWVLRRDGGI